MNWNALRGQVMPVRSDNRGNMRKEWKVNEYAFRKVILFGALAAIVLACLAMSCFSVDQGERGLVLRFGKIVSVAEPGFHLKMPLIEHVVFMDVRTRKESMELHLYSKDIQAATAQFSINFSLNPADVAQIYERYGKNYVNTLIKPQMMAQPKDVFGKYNAVDIVQNREQLSRKILDNMQAAMAAAEKGIQIQSVQLENIDFSDAYEKSVEERMKAEVEVQKVHQNQKRLEIEADMKRIQAKADADAKLLAAKAEADAIRMRGEAEAAAIQAKSDAMARNPSYVNLMQAERWDGRLPTTMLPSQSIPIVGGK